MISAIIVDDNALICEGIRDFINWESLGVSLLGICKNGLEGYNMAIALRPDLMIVDVDMPIMDGLTMVSRLNPELPDLNCIYISCFEDFRYVKGAMDLGAYKYVLKPIRFEELYEAIKDLCSNKKQKIKQKELYDELTSQIKYSKPILLEHFFGNLIYGRYSDEGYVCEHLRYLEMDISEQCYVIVFLEIDHYDLAYRNREMEQKYVIIEGIKKYVHDIVLHNHTGYIINQNHNSISFLILSGRDMKNEELNTIVDDLSELKNRVNFSLNTKITIGISEFSNQMIQMPKLLQNAIYAVKSKFYSKGNRIILSSDVKNFESQESYNLQELKNDIKTVFQQAEKDAIENLIDKYYNIHGMPYEGYIKSLTFSIMNIVKTIFIEENIHELKDIFESETVVWDKLHKLETLDLIIQWVKELLDDTQKCYEANKKKSRYGKIVDDIKNIIENDYASINNIEDVVKTLYISASHANLIFKQEMNMSIFDYVVYRRIEAAKELLSDPYSKVYEVSEKIGYKNKSYFSAIFKKFTGMTPRQYASRVN